MGSRLFERLARLERELASQEIVYRIVDRAPRAPRPAVDSTPPAPAPAPSPEPDEDEDV
jgi:hypothetical protein